MGTIEMMLTEGRSHAANAAAIADTAAQTGDPAKQYELMGGAIAAAEASLKALKDARRTLVGGMSRD